MNAFQKPLMQAVCVKCTLTTLYFTAVSRLGRRGSRINETLYITWDYPDNPENVLNR